MRKQVLIELVKELKQSNLVPTKKNTIVLANLTDKQVELFLDLNKTGFITQDNLDYAIEMVSKVEVEYKLYKTYEKLKESLGKLGSLETIELNNELLRFILNELSNDFNLGMNSINIISEIKNEIKINRVINILTDQKLSEEGLLNSILNCYQNLVKNYIEGDPFDMQLGSLNRVINTPEIRNAFMNTDDRLQNRTNYYNMLESFRKIIDEENIDKYDCIYEMIRSLSKNDKLDTNKVSQSVELCYYLEDINDLSTLQNILFTIGNWEDIDSLVHILNFYKVTEENDNLSLLTSNIYELLMNHYHFTKKDTDIFYHQLLELASSSMADDVTMTDIYEFISHLIAPDSDFIAYYQRNGKNVDFIECAFASGRYYLDNYLEISKNGAFMKDETYDQLLNSFSSKLNKNQLIAKSEVYASYDVEDVINRDDNVLRKLNCIINDPKFRAIRGELDLLKNPVFLESTFFKEHYLKLVHSNFTLLRITDIIYQDNFFQVLATFDFEDPNLMFYMSSILNKTKDSDVVKSLLEERKVDGGLESIANSLYDVLSSSDEELLDDYISVLEMAPVGPKLNADTKVIYQKKIGKKND